MDAAANPHQIRLTGPGEGNRYPAGVNEVVIKVGAEHTGGGFELMEEVCKPGFVSRLHKHNSRSQTFYVVEGSAIFTVDGTPFEAAAGSCIHVPPGVPHQIDSPDGMKMLMLYAPSGMEAMFSAVLALSENEANDPAVTARLTEEHDTVMLDDEARGTVLG